MLYNYYLFFYCYYESNDTTLRSEIIKLPAVHPVMHIMTFIVDRRHIVISYRGHTMAENVIDRNSFKHHIYTRSVQMNKSI